MKTLVIGLGNSILRDDSVGLRVAQALRPLLADRPDIAVEEDERGGLRLMERMVGFDRVIVIDAIVTGAAPGTLHRLPSTGRPTRRSASAHDADLPTALQLGRMTGASLPPDDAIVILAIEASDVLDFGTALSPEVEGAVDRAVEQVLSLLSQEEGS